MTPEQTRARYAALREEAHATSGYLNQPFRDEADVWAQKVYDLLEQTEAAAKAYRSCLPLIGLPGDHADEIIEHIQQAISSLAQAERAREESE